MWWLRQLYRWNTLPLYWVRWLWFVLWLPLNGKVSWKVNTHFFWTQIPKLVTALWYFDLFRPSMYLGRLKACWLRCYLFLFSVMKLPFFPVRSHLTSPERNIFFVVLTVCYFILDTLHPIRWWNFPLRQVRRDVCSKN